MRHGVLAGLLLSSTLFASASAWTQGFTSRRVSPRSSARPGGSDSSATADADSIPPPLPFVESQTTVTLDPARALALPDDEELPVATIVELSPDGVWSWFGDPRAVRLGHSTVVGWVNSRGDIRISKYDHDDGTVTTATLFTRLQIDDHANPSILALEDGRLMVFFCPHARSPMLYRISLYPEDISSWGPVRFVPRDSRFTYPNPIRLSDEGNKIYLFWRGSNWKPKFATSTDELTWSSSRTLLDTGTIFAYVKYASNGRNRIHFAFTDTHPEFSAENNIYHAYYEGGAFYRIDGTRIGDLSTLPLFPSQVDVVYASVDHGARAWIWDIALDERGFPVIAYSNYPSDTDHRYRYARWTGHDWNDGEVTAAGGTIDESGDDPFYSAGIILDHENPSIVFLCREFSGTSELERWITTDRGHTWFHDRLTSASAFKNIRPVVPLNRSPRDAAVVWLRGAYASYTDYHTSVAFLGMDAPRLVSFSIKPGSCPAPFNSRSRGALPAAILGTGTLDVRSIDVSSLRLAGITPLGSSIEDAASPAESDLCDCALDVPDGFEDLNLRFSTREILSAFPAPTTSEAASLRLTGRFLDGTPLLGGACLELLRAGPPSFALKAGPETGGSVQSIRYSLPQETRVTLAVYDVSGRKVATLLDSFQPPGSHFVLWNTQEHPSGVYFLRGQPTEILGSRKFVVLH